ncbi:ABC transporter ATP-binding protein, partial [[Ruminococcus] torques]|uniref:ABC transporter ATP-binding protein n=1 Tax=[Ruminococcus] torques TaxID=33039 RepID=UPI003AB2005F
TNTALLLVSHNMGVIAAACDYVYVMKDGKMIENGCADDIFYNPQTEYTKKLLSDATAEQLLVKEKVFAAQENPLFTVRHLKKRFQNEEGVNDVSFDICEGEVFALAGESGSGKTTLAKILTGLEQPDSGEVFCRGERVDRKNGKRNKNMHGKVRMIFQDPYSSLNPCMTINEMLTETLRAKEKQIKFDQKERKKDRQRQIEQMLTRVGLSSLDGKRYPRELSGGQRQKAAIARALLLEPELLICDEAVSSLDAATRTQILDLLLRVVKEKKIACLFISHDMALIRRISHRTGVLYKGTLAECAKTRDLCRDPWHPYTKALLDSVMPPDPLKARKQKVPAVHEGKSEGGCPYFGSCGYKMEMCKDAAPEMYDFEGRAVSCHLYSKQQRAGRNPNYKMTSQI